MKPIIMSIDEVRALLDGRKTMLRVPVKTEATNLCITEMFGLCGMYRDRPLGYQFDVIISTIEVGDVLYVRETWAKLNEKEYLYQADDTDVNVWKIWRDKGVGAVYDRWMSPVTMPREAARLFLRVKDVQVEKNKDSGRWEWVYEFERITEQEAK